MSEVPDFLVGWAREPGPHKVLDEARERLEAGRLGSRSTIKLELTPVERAQVGRLLPPVWAHTDAAVPIRGLRDGLATHGVTLEELLVTLGGPLRDRRAERQEARTAAASDLAAGLAELRSLLAEAEISGAEVDGAEMDGVLTRWVLSRAPASERAAAVACVVRALPTDGEVGLAVLAARLFGDAHALDRSEPLGRAVARFLALRAGVAEFVDPVESPEGWRAAWASGGVTCDAVSSQVLVLNLPLVGDSPAVAWCAATPGEPVWLSLRSLQGSFRLAAAADVFVCENPSIVEAAASAFGVGTRPLVCTFGRPSAAAWALLRGLGPDAHLQVRADGDATGWSIVDALRRAFPAAELWRMERGRPVYEEELLDELLGDLGGSRTGRGLA